MVTAADHPVRALFRELDGLRYPDGVTATRALVEGPEFFPGGCGLWSAERGKAWPAAPVRGVLVLGHNLDSVESYTRNVATGGLCRGPTWRNLGLLVDAAGIPRADCFLTNFFMGCGPNQVGAFPGAKDPEFVAACASVLRTTIRLLTPRAVLVLGGHTWRHLHAVAPELAVWRRIRTFSEVDHQDVAVLRAAVDGAPPFGITTVVHPSGADMGGNRNKRRYRGLAGIEAEAAAVREAVALGSSPVS
ncbi:MAG: uracil-DNA glycosylase family protein [Myxococcota bacterium]